MSGPLSHEEAAAILAELGAGGFIKRMPKATPLTERETDRRRAAEIVAQAILEQVQRCEEAERAAEQHRRELEDKP